MVIKKNPADVSVRGSSADKMFNTKSFLKKKKTPNCAQI